MNGNSHEIGAADTTADDNDSDNDDDDDIDGDSVNNDDAPNSIFPFAPQGRMTPPPPPPPTPEEEGQAAAGEEARPHRVSMWRPPSQPVFLTRNTRWKQTAFRPSMFTANMATTKPTPF